MDKRRGVYFIRGAFAKTTRFPCMLLGEGEGKYIVYISSNYQYVNRHLQCVSHVKDIKTFKLLLQLCTHWLHNNLFYKQTNHIPPPLIWLHFNADVRFFESLSLVLFRSIFRRLNFLPYIPTPFSPQVRPHSSMCGKKCKRVGRIWGERSSEIESALYYSHTFALVC